MFMKKILFTNASALVVSALFLTFAFTSCKKQASELNQVSEEFAFAIAPSAAALSPYNLKVTVDNSNGNKVTSDGLGDYTNGSQYVTAIIDKYGNFIFDSFNSNSVQARPIRKLNFDFSDVITQYSTPPSTNTSKNYHLEAFASVTPGITFTPLQNLVTNQSECVSFRAWGVTNGTIEWRALFHSGFDDRDTSRTGFGLVTRVDATHWTISGLGNCTPASNQNVTALRGPNANTIYGFYRLPFSITLTKL